MRLIYQSNVRCFRRKSYARIIALIVFPWGSDNCPKPLRKGKQNVGTGTLAGGKHKPGTMHRPICFDLTHLIDRIEVPWPSGIDKVDLAYAHHFAEHSLGPFIRYGAPLPFVVAQAEARDFAGRSRRAVWQDRDFANDDAFLRVRSALTGLPTPASDSAPRVQTTRLGSSWLRRFKLEIDAFRRRRNEGRGDIPPGAIYLNVAQHKFEHHEYFEWLDARPDVLPVFLIHDLLPLDYPEFFHARDAEIFERRMQMAFTRGKAFIVTSQSVRDRVASELANRGLKQVPMTVAPLPSSLGDFPAASLVDSALAATPYFVTVGTIEPRKNHLLLLSVWRAMAEAAREGSASIPKLVVVGGRGWENEQVLDVLERGRLTRPHVIEASGLSSAGLSTLVANARALLIPSFAEGYGLPLVEALSIGTPVVTTDAPVFREVTQQCAVFLSPIDGLGWEQAIRTMSDPQSAESRAARTAALQFRSPQWSEYFRTVTDFLATLR